MQPPVLLPYKSMICSILGSTSQANNTAAPVPLWPEVGRHSWSWAWCRAPIMYKWIHVTNVLPTAGSHPRPHLSHAMMAPTILLHYVVDLAGSRLEAIARLTLNPGHLVRAPAPGQVLYDLQG